MLDIPSQILCIRDSSVISYLHLSTTTWNVPACIKTDSSFESISFNSDVKFWSVSGEHSASLEANLEISGSNVTRSNLVRTRSRSHTAGQSASATYSAIESSSGGIMMVMLRRVMTGGIARRTCGIESRGNLYPCELGPKVRSADVIGNSRSDGKGS